MKKKISAITLIMLLVCSLATVTASAKSTDWKSLLSKSSVKYNNNLAMIAADMCDKSARNKSDEIVDLLTNTYGLDGVTAYDYGKDYAFVLGYKKLNKKTTLVVVHPRGSITTLEMLRDFATWKTYDFYGYRVYDHIYEFKDKVWNKLSAYVNEHRTVKNAKNYKVVLAGHSLAGAAVGVLAAQMNNEINGNEWFSGKLKKKNIYAYTFAAIKTLKQKDNVEEGYENIHNIYNYYDPFGPHGSLAFLGVGAINSKFGHTDMFKPADGGKGGSISNHDIKKYYSSMQNGLISCTN